MNRRIGLGLLAAIIAQVVFGYIFSLFPINMIVQMATASFISAFIGSYVAKRNFILPATILWLATWVLTLYILVRVSNGQSSAYTLLEFNKVAILVSLMATLLGCIAFTLRTGKHQAATI